MTEKRYSFNVNKMTIEKDGKYFAYTTVEHSKVVDELNALHEKNQELKSELKVYRKIASCSNCEYHNYDWYDDGDEFEICEKGNDVDDRICKDWKEFW